MRYAQLLLNPEHVMVVVLKTSACAMSLLPDYIDYLIAIDRTNNEMKVSQNMLCSVTNHN